MTYHSQAKQEQHFQSVADKYAEREESPDAGQHQSKSFKYLTNLMDEGRGNFHTIILIFILSFRKILWIWYGNRAKFYVRDKVHSSRTIFINCETSKAWLV